MRRRTCIIVSVRKCWLWVTFESTQRKPMSDLPLRSNGYFDGRGVLSSVFEVSLHLRLLWKQRHSSQETTEFEGSFRVHFLSIGPSPWCFSHSFVEGRQAGTVWAWSILVLRCNGAQLEVTVLKESLYFFPELGGTHTKRRGGSQRHPHK